MEFLNETWRYIVVFISMGIVDYFWGHYIKGLNDGNALKASVFSSLIVLTGAFTTINYIGNHWLLIPAVLGGAIGTYYAAKHNKKRNKIK